jgi:hypothetical protein
MLADVSAQAQFQIPSVRPQNGAGGFYEGLEELLTLAGGGMLLAWNQHVSTAYLINPATRTRTTLQLHGVPPDLFIAPPLLAW